MFAFIGRYAVKILLACLVFLQLPIFFDTWAKEGLEGLIIATLFYFMYQDNKAHRMERETWRATIEKQHENSAALAKEYSASQLKLSTILTKLGSTVNTIGKQTRAKKR